VFGKRRRGAGAAKDPVRQRLLRIDASEMPAIERESAKSIYFAIQRSPDGDTARTIVDTFLATLLVEDSEHESVSSEAVKLFRSEFVANGRRMAESSEDWNRLLSGMHEMVDAPVAQSNDPQRRAVLCATWLLALIAFDASQTKPDRQTDF
jgi:hypothetical protein